MQAAGLTLAEVHEEVELWLDNLPAYNLFIVMGTQWRVGMGGPYGLDYSALPALWPLMSIRESDRADAFGDLREMESAALEQMNRK